MVSKSDKPGNPSKSGFFVTGTDTEVGKTLISGALIIQLKKQHAVVAGFKPVVAGMSLISGKWCNEDLLALSSVMNYKPQEDFLDICPYQLSTPAAPHLVAKESNIHLDYEVMLNVFKKVHEKSDAIVVEGVGGFKVPFHDGKTSADFAQDIGLPIVLVVGMRLGCINHALLTAEAIQSRGLRLAGWVANTIGPMTLLQENIATLEHLIPAPLLGVIPELPKEFVQVPYGICTMEKAASYLRNIS
uniref:dethiobiotin synthase n=1 Tax=Polynucleobacter sp. TaxID=2029855 RepID=UPI004047153F